MSKFRRNAKRSDACELCGESDEPRHLVRVGDNQPETIRRAAICESCAACIAWFDEQRFVLGADLGVADDFRAKRLLRSIWDPGYDKAADTWRLKRAWKQVLEALLGARIRVTAKDVDIDVDE